MKGRWPDAALFLAAFAWFLGGVAPGLHWLDSGELISAGHHLGISHPPGQPVWTLLAKAASLLPLGSIPFRMALISAAAAAGCVLLTLDIGRKMFGEAWPAAAFLAIAAACHPFLGVQARRPEVYALVTLLILAAVRALLDAPDRRALAAACLCAGILGGAHPLLGGAAAVAGVAWVLGTWGPRRALRSLAAGAPLALLGLAAYGLLPLRTRAGAALAWGRPDTWERFLHVVTAADYRVNHGMTVGAAAWESAPGARAIDHAVLVAQSLGVAVSVLVVVGLVVGAARRPLGALLMAGVALGTTATSLTQRVFFPDNPDIHGYLTPLALLLVVAGGGAVATLWRGLAAPRPARWAAGAMFVASGFLPALGWSPAVDARTTHLPRVLASAALSDVPAHGVAMTVSDHLGFGAMELQRVEGARPDAAVAIAPLLKSSWHLQDLKRRRPTGFVPWVDDGDPRDPEGRWLAHAGCAASTQGRCRVEQPHQLPHAARPGTWGAALLAPGPATGPPGVATASLEWLATMSEAPRDDRFLRFHTKLVAHHRMAAGAPDEAARVAAWSLGRADPISGSAPGTPGPSRLGDVPRLDPVFVSRRADMLTVLADALASGGRPDAAASIWDSAEGRRSPEMTLLAVHHLFASGASDAAEVAWKRALTAFPGHRIDILYNLGVFFARQGATQTARMQLATLVEEAPEHPRAATARRYLAHLDRERTQ